MGLDVCFPQFFLLVYSEFFANVDIGIYTVLGSLAFNELLLIGIVSFIMLTHMQKVPLSINSWPITRDTFCLCALVFVLVCVMNTGAVTWYDILILSLLSYSLLSSFPSPSQHFYVSYYVVRSCFSGG